jgi:hypothetical protein
MDGWQQMTNASNVMKGLQGSGQEEWPTVRKQARASGKWQTPENTLSLMHHMLAVITENTNPSLVTQGWVGDKPCLVTMDTWCTSL